MKGRVEEICVVRDGLLAEGLVESVPCHQHPLYVILTPGPCTNMCRLEHSDHQHMPSSWQSGLDPNLLGLIIHGDYPCLFPLTHYAS